MKFKVKDENYLKIVNDILNNDIFLNIDNIEHHGTSRLSHSLRVSYYSYKITKKLKLNYINTARAGLLHDFFMSYEDRNKREKLLSTFTHPKYALINASNNFKLNNMEKNIIRSHMFPLNYAIPKYSESWIVSFVDKCVAVYEFITCYRYQLSYATNYLYLFIIVSLFKLY